MTTEDTSEVDERPSCEAWSLPWWTLRLAVLVAIVAPLLIWLFTPNKFRFEARAWLRINSTQPYLVYDLPHDELFARTQVELIKSPLTLRDVLALPDAARHLNHSDSRRDQRGIFGDQNGRELDTFKTRKAFDSSELRWMTIGFRIARSCEDSPPK